MISTKKWMMATLGIVFCLTLSISMVQAEPFDFTVCQSGTFSFLSTSEEMNFAAVEHTGITMSNHPNMTFGNCGSHTVGVARGPLAKPIGYGYLKLLDTDGDFVVGEIAGTQEEINLKFLHGTGKWKGITGGGKGRQIARAKPLSPGTAHACIRYTGTFELPKK